MLPQAIAGETFDLVAANISGQTIERLARDISTVLREDGTLIAGGFLEDAVEALERVFAEAEMEPVGAEAEGVWRTIIARKKSGHA